MRLKIIGIITIAGMIFVANAIIAEQSATPQELKMNELNKKPLSVEENLNSIATEGGNKTITPRPTTGNDDKFSDPKSTKPDSIEYKTNTNVDDEDKRPEPRLKNSDSPTYENKTNIGNKDYTPVPSTDMGVAGCEHEIKNFSGGSWLMKSGVLALNIADPGRIFVIESATVYIKVPSGKNIYKVSLLQESKNSTTWKNVVLAIPVHNQGAGLDNSQHFAGTVSAKTYIFDKYKYAIEIGTTAGNGDFRYSFNGYYVDTDCAQP